MDQGLDEQLFVLYRNDITQRRKQSGRSDTGKFVSTKTHHPPNFIKKTSQEKESKLCYLSHL